MKKLRKKVLPALLAFLVAMTSLLPMVNSSNAASAKNHNLDLRRVSNWRYNSSYLKRDVKSEIFYIDGEWAFCIEPGLVMKKGTGREVSAKSLGLTEKQMKDLALIVWYGYRSQDEDEFDYFFTQSAIWKYLGSKQVHYRKGHKGEDLAKFNSWYKKIMYKVNHFHDLPSFNRETIKVKQGETTSIQDKNRVLNGLKIKSVIGGKASISGNTLKVTADGSKDKMEIDFNRGMTPKQTRTQFIVKKGNNQAVSYLTGNDPYKAYVDIEVDKTGGVFLDKSITRVIDPDHSKYKQGSWKDIIFELYSEELGKIGEYKLSENGDLKVDNLAVGKYYFLEKNQPGNYITNSEKIHFEIKPGKDNKIHGATLDVANELTRISFVKENMDGKVIPGAKLSIINSKGEKVHTFTTKETPYLVEGLEKGEYELIEEEAPEGYVRSKAKVKFTVTDTLKTEKIVMKNKKVNIKKVDAEGNPLAGAEFDIIDKETGDKVDSFTSTEDGYDASNLKEENTYILRETKAPEGYAIMADFEFTVSHEKENQEIVAKNKKVEIKKVDSEGKNLPGAKMQILDQNGKVVEEFITTKETYIAKNLKELEEYILREVEAPEGYEKAADVKFTVTKEKNQTVTMIDENKIGWIEMDDNLKLKNRLVKTSDKRMMKGYLILLMLSSLTLSVLAIRKTIERNK